MAKANAISILRKRVVTNIPGFFDDTTGDNPQNEWIKLYDLDCIDFAPSNTARVYNLEDAPNYSNNDTMYYVEFHFESARQSAKPPYDINEGDYVAYYQNDEKHYCRIAKIINSQIFPGCCVYQIICNITNPREIERLLGCGVLSIIPDSEFGEKEGQDE